MAKEVIQSAGQLKCGDHISFPAKYCGRSYAHHAIVVAWKGCNRIKIIHAAAKKTKKCYGQHGYEVREQVLNVGKRINQRKLFRYIYDPNECSEPYEVICKAKSMVDQDYNFHPFTHNCKHFVLSCTSVSGEHADVFDDAHDDCNEDDNDDDDDDGGEVSVAKEEQLAAVHTADDSDRSYYCNVM